MSASNTVISGDYNNGRIDLPSEIRPLCIVYSGGFTGPSGIKNITAKEIERYDLIEKRSEENSQKKVKRGIVGGIIAGTTGAIIGSSSVSNEEIYTVALYFKNGKKSLIEIDGTRYKELLKNLF